MVDLFSRVNNWQSGEIKRNRLLGHNSLYKIWKYRDKPRLWNNRVTIYKQLWFVSKCRNIVQINFSIFYLLRLNFLIFDWGTPLVLFLLVKSTNYCSVAFDALPKNNLNVLKQLIKVNIVAAYISTGWKSNTARSSTEDKHFDFTCRYEPLMRYWYTIADNRILYQRLSH